MKLFGFFLMLLALGAAGIGVNLLTGIGMTRIESGDPQIHLYVAVISLVLLGTSSGGLILSSGKFLEESQKRLIFSKPRGTEAAFQLTERRLKSVATSLASFGVLVISLMSGSITQSGHWPILHSLLGGSVFILTIISMKNWILLLRECSKTNL